MRCEHIGKSGTESDWIEWHYYLMSRANRKLLNGFAHGKQNLLNLYLPNYLGAARLFIP